MELRESLHAREVEPAPKPASFDPDAMTRVPPNRIVSAEESAFIETEPRNCTVNARPISASLTCQRCDSVGSTGPSSVVPIPAMKNPTYKSGMDGGASS